MLVLEAVVLPGLGVAQLRIDLVRVLLLAVVSELIQRVGVARRVAYPVGGGRPPILRCTDLVSALALQVLLLADQTDHGAMWNWPLTARDARADRLVEIDNASGALQRVAPEAV